MSQPVYMLVIGYSYKEAFCQLSDEEKKNLWAKVGEIGRRAGEKQVIACNSRWADEEIGIWAVFEYPDMEAYQKKVEELEQLEWWRYVSTKTILGTKIAE